MNRLLAGFSMDKYSIKILSGWQLEKDDSFAIRSLLSHAERFPQLFHIRCTCLLQAAQIFSEYGCKAEAQQLFRLLLATDEIETSGYLRVMKYLRKVRPHIFGELFPIPENQFQKNPFGLSPNLKESVSTLLRENGIEPSESLWKYIRPCIEFSPTQDITRVGQSRMGGLPDVPEGWEWPKKLEFLEFLAQFNLEDLAPIDVSGLLPKRGLLQIFGDFLDRDYHINFYDGDLTLLRPASPPVSFPMFDAQAKYHDSPMVYNSVPVEPYSTILVTNYTNSEEGDGKDDIEEALSILNRNLGWVVGWQHRMFGPHGFNDDIIDIWEERTGRRYYDLNDEERKAVWPELDEWILLFQMDSCDAVGTMFNDAGIFYFIIHKEDLAALRFDNVFVSMWSG